MINCTSTTEGIILKAPSTVDIPIEEYKSLVRSEQLAELTKRVLDRCQSFNIEDTLSILYTTDEEHEEKLDRKRKAAAAMKAKAEAKAAANDQNKEDTKSEPESE